MKDKPQYSGKNRSGICKCKHSWEDHHHGIVANEEYYKATKENYVCGECLYYGFNELGGLRPIKKKTGTIWVHHCGSYVDQKSEEKRNV